MVTCVVPCTLLQDKQLLLTKQTHLVPAPSNLLKIAALPHLAPRTPHCVPYSDATNKHRLSTQHAKHVPQVLLHIIFPAC